MENSKITAIGSYVPEQVISNSWFTDKIDTQEEWIISRTGIRERRFAAENEFTSDLAIKAVTNLILQYPEVQVSDVDFIIVATTTADQVMPNMASRVQQHFGIVQAGSIDVAAACAGFVYGIILANGLINAGSHRKVLVIGAETLSKFTDYTDRSSCILFGDGAGAVLIESNQKAGIFKSVTGTDGSHGKDLYLSQHCEVINGEAVTANGKIHQNGKVVFKWAVQHMSSKMLELMEVNQMLPDEVDWVILHSANLRIIEAVAEATKFPLSRMLTSIELFGNTSSASIPIAWDIATKSGKLRQGDKVLLLGFGGGLTYAGVIIEI